MKKFLCWLFGHCPPVYHDSRAFWWCPRCGRVLGMEPALWTDEAMVAHAARVRHRKLEGFES